MTPKLTEVLCPKCGAITEVFILLGGKVGKTGTLASDETCPSCGYVLEEGTAYTDYEPA